jgi:hypothetical protein
MRESVKSRLAFFGYVVETIDDWVLDFVIDKVENEIKNECNIDEIPAGLYQVAVDMAVGEFLFAKKGSGQALGIDAEAAVKSIKEGDTQISYAIPDTSITLDGMIDMLRHCGRGQLISYRRFVW